jgi:hypothetical protein
MRTPSATKPRSVPIGVQNPACIRIVASLVLNTLVTIAIVCRRVEVAKSVRDGMTCVIRLHYQVTLLLKPFPFRSENKIKILKNYH